LKEIVFPIALRVSLPSWTGLTLGVMKDTALVLWIGVIELLRTSQVIVTRIQEPLLVLSVCGLIYFALSYPISLLGAKLEARWRDLD
jgi:polar amino acid transport system permease protein